MGIGLLFVESFDPSFSWMSTSIFFTVWFSVKSLWNLLLSVAMSASVPLLLFWSGLLRLFIDWCEVSVFSVNHSSFIQLIPSSECACFVVISNSSCFDLPSINMFAKVLSSNFISLSFTSR